MRRAESRKVVPDAAAVLHFRPGVGLKPDNCPHPEENKHEAKGGVLCFCCFSDGCRCCRIW